MGIQFPWHDLKWKVNENKESEAVYNFLVRPASIVLMKFLH